MNDCAIFQTLIVLIGIHCKGGTVKLDVIDGLIEEGIFECNSQITLRCRFNSTSIYVQWSIGNPIGRFPDANCGGNMCANSSAFPGRYHYTHDQSGGFSDLKIANASFEDDTMKYQCYDGTSSEIYNATTIIAPPKVETTSVNVTYSTNHVTASLKTGCIYPLKDLNITWFSTLVNGSDLKFYEVGNKSIPCSTIPNCARANTGVESGIDIHTATNGQERQYSVNISFGSIHFSTGVGKFNVSVDKTETTTYSTVKLTPTPTIVITSMTTPVITPTQTIVISPTPSTVVSPTSTIIVASSSTDKTTFATKQNFPSIPKSNKSVIIAAVTGAVVILIIIISALVCYIKRKKRNKKKAKEYMFRKKESNVQENRM